MLCNLSKSRISCSEENLESLLIFFYFSGLIEIPFIGDDYSFFEIFPTIPSSFAVGVVFNCYKSELPSEEELELSNSENFDRDLFLDILLESRNDPSSS